jgi:very-short-patch-repair endonuclease
VFNVKYTICPICNKQVTNNNYAKHIEAHNKPSRYLHSLDHDDLNCKYCGKLCKNKNSLAQHEIRCVSNSNRIQVLGNQTSRSAWNKGLTKETDVRVAKNAESVSKTLRQKVSDGWKPFFATDDYWTDEMRSQRSVEKVQLFKEHPELHPNRRLASNKVMNYPEQVAATWLSDHNISYEYQFKTVFNNKSRYVDFYVADYKLYIEIDGEYWHANSQDKDAAKDLFALQNQGITTLRIKPKPGVEKQLNEFFNKYIQV